MCGTEVMPGTFVMPGAFVTETETQSITFIILIFVLFSAVCKLLQPLLHSVMLLILTCLNKPRLINLQWI